MFKLVQNHKVLYFISLILIVSYSVVDLLKSILMSYIFDDHLLDSISSEYNGWASPSNTEK